MELLISAWQVQPGVIIGLLRQPVSSLWPRVLDLPMSLLIGLGEINRLMLKLA